MDKVRLDFYRELGGELVDNDECTDVGGYKEVMNLSDCDWNIIEPENERCHITAFTERKNKGVQPVPDGFPVVLNYGKSQSKCNAEMCNHWSGDSVKSWKPDYDKLLEMQKEHDSKQEKGSCMKNIRSFALESDADIEELMINAKESKMSKDNKHPHHDLIVEWLKDTSKAIQGRILGDDDWDRVDIVQVIHCDEDGYSEFRFKPREFQKGHWYPCIYSYGDIEVNMWNGEGFVSITNAIICSQPSEFMQIGESLGEIKFGGEE